MTDCRSKDVAIESSESFPLLALPHELIEEVATWFSRREAVKVLTINKTLHEVFARSLWRRVDIRDSLLDQSATTWQRYGPFVRIAEVGIRTRAIKAKFRSCVDNATVWIPNVQHLTVYSTPVVKSLLVANQELRNLRRVQVFFHTYISSDPSVCMAVIDWIRRIEKQKQHGQKINVNWALQNMQPEHFVLLNHIVDTVAVENVTSNSITMELNHQRYEPELIKVDSTLAQMLTKLDIRNACDTAHFKSQYKHFLGSRNIEYPRLELLLLDHEPHEQDDNEVGVTDSLELVALDPAQFPALRRLKLNFGVPSAEAFDRFLKYKFYTVMELDLTYILDISVLERSIGYFPNIQRLVLHSCWIAVNLRMIVDSLPQLETLVLISVNGLNYSKKCLYPPPSPSPLSSSLSMLKELAILEFRAGKQLALTSEFWQFVAQKLPKLEALKLYDCEHREDTIVAHSTQHGLAIRTLVAKMEEKQLVKLVSVLPKLHVLKLMTSSAEECIKWQKLYPRLKVERSHAIRDFT